MLAFFVSLISALTIGTLFANFGALGSCFEGSCGYAAAFIVTPIIALAMLPIWRRWVKRWAEGCRILFWMIVAFPAAVLVHDSLIYVVPVWTILAMTEAVKRLRLKNLPIVRMLINSAELQAKSPL
jgi:hypothetical protein